MLIRIYDDHFQGIEFEVSNRYYGDESAVRKIPSIVGGKVQMLIPNIV